MSDIASEIWDRSVPGRTLNTAEERAAVDRALKVELGRIEDPGIRNHAASILRQRRAALYRPSGRLDEDDDPVWDVIAELRDRLAWIEKHLSPRRHRQLRRRERRL